MDNHDKDWTDWVGPLLDWLYKLFVLSVAAQIIAIPLLLAYGVWRGVFPIGYLIGFGLVVGILHWGWLKRV